jgi:HSP20 family molecular chaperone IbpA
MYNKRNSLDLFELDNPFFFNFVNAFEKDSRLLRSDIIENEKDYEIIIDVPGYKKSDIKISLDNKNLTVSLENKKELSENSKVLHSERFYGTITRSYYVGNITQKDIKATIDNGLLVITLPKESYRKEEEKKFIEIH